MAKRHDNALYAQEGACNGLAVSKALAEAYQEARAEGKDTDGYNRDPAVQMILHQLCHLARVPVSLDWEGYDAAYQACIDNASDSVLTALNLADRKTKTSTETAA